MEKIKQLKKCKICNKPIKSHNSKGYCHRHQNIMWHRLNRIESKIVEMLREGNENDIMPTMNKERNDRIKNISNNGYNKALEDTKKIIYHLFERDKLSRSQAIMIEEELEKIKW